MGEIRHQVDGHKGAFVYDVQGRQMGEMSYTMAGAQQMIIEHTEVDESLKGQGIGKQLLGALVSFVREQGIVVIPLCPFARATFMREKDWNDVLQKR